jgi:hypothetical protein
MRRENYKFDLGLARSGLFLRTGLDRHFSKAGDLPVGHETAPANAIIPPLSESAHPPPPLQSPDRTKRDGTKCDGTGRERNQA